jgi:hypothetical protein
MLASIHPLGERARHNRWGLTVTAHTLGSWAGAVAVFGLAAALGMVVDVPAALAAPAALIAAAFDLRALRGRAVPGPRRQVNEDWLNRYRGWVYGAGFGLQLGSAVSTIVTSAAVYLALVLTAVVGDLGAGVLVGSVYGLGRALPLWSARAVQQPEHLVVFHVHRGRAAWPVQLWSLAGLVGVAAALGVGFG